LKTITVTFSGIKEALDFYFDDGTCLPPSLSVRQVFVDRSLTHETVKLDVCATIGYYVYKQPERSRFILELFFRHRLGDREIAARIRRNHFMVKAERVKTMRRLEQDLREIGVLRSWKCR
jgi:hypothetical protein